MKTIYKKFLYHIIENFPVYIIIFLMFIALCSHLNIQFYDLKNILRYIVKTISFIAFIGTTVYLFYDVIYTVESNNGIIKQNKELIQKFENAKSIVLDAMINSAKNKLVRKLEILSIYKKDWTNEEFNFFVAKLDEIDSKQTNLRNQNFESWKWKIGTLITLNAAFLSIAKFF